MNTPTPKLSVIVLSYKCGESIHFFVDPLQELLDREEPEWEMILVGNYFDDTGDATPDVVNRIADAHPRIQAVTQVKQGMMGWDMKCGLEMATGQTIAVIDGDNQMPYEDIIRVYKKLTAENLDFVKTFRTQRDDGAWRQCISTVYNLVFHILFPGLHSRDINSKPKIMTREAYDALDLKSDDWFIDAEIMIQARRHRFNVGEIECVFRNLQERPSFVKPQAILEFMGNLFVYRLREFGHWFKK